MRHASLLVLLAGAVVAGSTAARAESPADGTLQPLDVFQLAWANNPQVAPDGKRVVYERSFFDITKDRKRSNLWLVNVDSGEQRPLTSGLVNDGGAAWSGDGRRLAYVSASDGSAQIHVRWMDTGQAARITNLTEAPQGLAWSPDGKWMAFAMRVAAEEKPLAQLPPKPEGAEWAPPVKVIDRLIYRVDGAGYVDPGYTQLFVVAADGGAPRQVTQGHFDAGAPVWTRDGKALIFASNRHADWEYEARESDLYRVELASGALTQLTTRKGPDTNPVLSPDGRQLAYLGFDDRQLGAQDFHLYVLDLASGTSRDLTPSLDRSVSDPAWDGDGRGLYFSYEDAGRGMVAWVSAQGGRVETLANDLGGTSPGRPYTGGALAAAGGRVAYTRDSEYRLADLAVVSRGGKPRVLTDLNANLLGHRALGKVESFTVKSSADGRAIQAWLVTPPDFEAAKKYPLLLEIHGGPYAAYGPHFAPETQLYAAAGYVVLYMNPRGSTGYGQAFQDLIQDAYPGQDYDDLMSGVDAVLARGFVDPKRLYVTGGSGGGALTAWIVGHTDRFRAAVSAKPVINWASFVLTSDFYPFFAKYWFANPPWEKLDNYLARSPITYVGKVSTPTLLMVGESDHRTPITEAEQFYQALKLRHVDTALVRIPEASHEINRRPSNMLAQVLYTLGWFERHGGKADRGAP
ncbi:MAG: S9 family peptidase [Lysobacterales bacterium]